MKHYEKLNPFRMEAQNTEIVDDIGTIGFLDRQLTEDIRLLSKDGKELLRTNQGWAAFIYQLSFYAIKIRLGSK